MTETVRVAIIDWEGKDILVSVVPTQDDPTVNGIVVCNADWSSVG